MLRGIFSRGSSNVNVMESAYRLNPLLIFLGVLCGTIFQAVVLIVIYFGLNCSIATLMVLLVLILFGDLSFGATASYMARLYLREEMVDTAMLFSNHTVNILREGGTLVNYSYDALKMAKSDMKEEMQLLLELRQLRDELKKDNNLDFVPLVPE